MGVTRAARQRRDPRITRLCQRGYRS